MSPVRRAGAFTAWSLLLISLPFNEGSASPVGLLVAHLLALACVWLSAPMLCEVRWALLAPALGAAAVAVVSGGLGSYRFASVLAVFDLAIALVILLSADAICRSQPHGPSFRGWCLGAIVISAAAQAAIILVRWLWSAGADRSPGTLLNSNHAAAYLLAALWCLLAYRRPDAAARDVSSPDPHLAQAVLERRPVRVVLASALLAGALLQASRGALAAGLVGAAVYLTWAWSTMRPASRRAAAAVCALVCVIGTIVVAHRLATRDDPYAWDRLAVWRTAIEVAKSHPLAGVGPGVFPHVSFPFDAAHENRPVHYAKHVEATHSDPLRVVAETGLLGGVAFAWLLIAILVLMRRALTREGDARAAGIPLAAGFAALLVQSCVENLSTRPAVFYTGALLCGVLLSNAPLPPPASSLRRKEVRFFAWPTGPTVFGATALLWIALVLVVAPFVGDRQFHAYERGDGSRAVRYAKALLANPIHPDYRAALAEAVLAGRSRQADDLRLAFRSIDAAIALKPVDPRFELIRARLARQALLASGGESSWFVMADESYARAIPLDPHRPQARLERGFMLLGGLRAGAALEEADATLASEPNAFEARRLRASALRDLDRPEAARQEVKEALRRRDQLRSYVPENPYEAQVLAWNRTEWAALQRQLGMPEL